MMMMELALQSSRSFNPTSISQFFHLLPRPILLPANQLRRQKAECRYLQSTSCMVPLVVGTTLRARFGKQDGVLHGRRRLGCLVECRKNGNDGKQGILVSDTKSKEFKVLATKGVLLAAMVCGIMMVGCRRVAAAEGVTLVAKTGANSHLAFAT